MSIYEISALIIGGLLVGFINTLAGGGSIISLSILMYIMGLPANIANGTNRIAITLQTLAASSSFKQQKALDWKKGIKLGIPSILGSIVGASIAVDINEDIFEKAVAIIMLIMLVFIFVKPNRWLNGVDELINKKISPLMMLIFFFIGIYGGFIHVGIGYFLLAAIVLGAGYDLVKANAIKVFIVFLYAPFSLAIYIYNGQVHFLYGIVLAIGNVIGALLASKFAVKKGSRFVRWVIVVVILLSSAKIFGLINI